MAGQTVLSFLRRTGTRLAAGVTGVGAAAFAVASAHAESEPAEEHFYLNCIRKGPDVKCHELREWRGTPPTQLPSSEARPDGLAHPRSLPESDSQLPNFYALKYDAPRNVHLDNKQGNLYICDPATPLSKDATEKGMRFLRENINWEIRDNGHFTAWYCDRGWEIDYEYDVGKAQPWSNMPDWMLVMRDHMMDTLNLPRDNPPNSCNLNWYSHKDNHIGAHQDNEVLFDAVDAPAKIISFTLGAERPFQVWDFEKTGVLSSVVLKNGAYAVMEGRFQRYLRHAVPRVEEECGPRFNLTWRWVVNKESGSKPKEYQPGGALYVGPTAAAEP